MTPIVNDTRLLSNARAQLLLETLPSAAFFATLAMQLNLVATEEVETLSTDGTSLFFNPAYVANLPPQERIGVMLHETCHCAYLHMFRRGYRDPEEYNISADHVINLQLVDWGYQLPKNIYCDRQYAGMSVEQVYAKRMAGKPPSPPPPEPKGGKPEGTGSQPSQDPQKDAKGASQSDPKPSEEEPLPKKEKDSSSSSGGGEGTQIGPKPSILPGCPTGDFTDPNPKAQAADKDGNPGPPPMTAEDWAIVTESAFLASQAAGTVPGSLEGLLKQSRKAANDWQATLKQFISQVANQEQSWSTPNRRFLGSGLILPGIVKDQVGELAVILDTSGSTRGAMLQAFSDEMRSIIGEIQPERVTVLYADSRVQKVEVFERGDSFELHSSGGGGTKFQPAFDYLDTNNIRPLAAIYLTDLDCFDQPLTPEYPVIWCHPIFVRRQPPFPGDTVAIDVV